MTNKELNSWNQEAEERIIKALKKILELMRNEGDFQRSAIISKSLDLINRLQRENGKIEKIIKAADRLIETQKAEIERLKAEQQMADGYADALEEYAKAEAVKEFAEKLEAYIPNIDGETTMECVKNAIKQTLKEMVGEQRKEDESNGI